MKIQLNYPDLVNMVNTYRNGGSANVVPNHVPISVKEIADMANELTLMKCDGIRMYFATGDYNVKDTAGQDIMHTGFDRQTILIAVPTVNKVDDNVINNIVTCFPIGVTVVPDNIGMCPPACPAPGAKVI